MFVDKLSFKNSMLRVFKLFKITGCSAFCKCRICYQKLLLKKIEQGLQQHKLYLVTIYSNKMELSDISIEKIKVCSSSLKSKKLKDDCEILTFLNLIPKFNESNKSKSKTTKIVMNFIHDFLHHYAIAVVQKRLKSKQNSADLVKCLRREWKIYCRIVKNIKKIISLIYEKTIWITYQEETHLIFLRWVVHELLEDFHNAVAVVTSSYVFENCSINESDVAVSSKLILDASIIFK